MRRRERAAWPHARHGAPARAGDTLLVLAFSGGGTRAAAFSHGVLETPRDIEVTALDGRCTRLLDQVGVIAGVSGGSFTALAYGLQGDKLFDDYETRFLKRNVQGERLDRSFNPGYWGAPGSTGWGRSELAADHYDEILFDGATYADLMRCPGPLIVASATDVSSGARFYYTQVMFDILCSDLSAIRLARAAASSSAVPDQARDTAVRWQTCRAIRDCGAIADKTSPALRAVERGPDTELYVIDVSFAGVEDAAERDFMNALPTSFVLSAEAVGRLPAAARTVLTHSTEFQRLLAELGHRGSAATAP